MGPSAPLGPDPRCLCTASPPTAPPDRAPTHLASPARPLSITSRAAPSRQPGASVSCTSTVALAGINLLAHITYPARRRSLLSSVPLPAPAAYPSYGIALSRLTLARRAAISLRRGSSRLRLHFPQPTRPSPPRPPRAPRAGPRPARPRASPPPPRFASPCRSSVALPPSINLHAPHLSERRSSRPSRCAVVHPCAPHAPSSRSFVSHRFPFRPRAAPAPPRPVSAVFVPRAPILAPLRSSLFSLDSPRATPPPALPAAPALLFFSLTPLLLSCFSRLSILISRLPYLSLLASYPPRSASPSRPPALPPAYLPLPLSFTSIPLFLVSRRPLRAFPSFFCPSLFPPRLISRISTFLKVTVLAKPMISGESGNGRCR